MSPGAGPVGGAFAAPAQATSALPSANMPPLPVEVMSGIRPPDVVREVHAFAAHHPEVLDYVPCFCGCENAGHRGNTDCFVQARDGNGNVTRWEPHGAT